MFKVGREKGGEIIFNYGKTDRLEFMIFPLKRIKKVILRYIKVMGP